MILIEKEKNKRNFFYIICAILIIILYNLRNDTSELAYEKFKNSQKDVIQTNISKIFIGKDKKGFVIYILQKDGSVKTITDLKGVGKIQKNTPILIYTDEGAGYIDEIGNFVIPIIYEQATNFIDGIAGVKKGKFGIIDEKGRELLPPIYDEVYLGIKKRVILKKEGEYFLSNLKRAEALEVDFIYQLNNEKFIFRKDGYFGIMDFQGDVIVKNKFEEISNNIDKTFIGFLNGKYGIYSLDGYSIATNLDYVEQIDMNIFRGGTSKKGMYAFISEERITEEIYTDIEKVLIGKDTYYAGVLNREVDLLDKKGRVLKRILKEEYELIKE